MENMTEKPFLSEFYDLAKKDKISDIKVKKLICIFTVQYGLTGAMGGASSLKFKAEFSRFIYNVICDYNELLLFSENIVKEIKHRERKLYVLKILSKFHIISKKMYSDFTFNDSGIFIYHSYLRNKLSNIFINLRNLFYLLDILNNFERKDIGAKNLFPYKEKIISIRDSIIHLEGDIRANSLNLDGFRLISYEDNKIFYYDDKIKNQNEFDFDEISKIINLFLNCVNTLKI